MKPGTNYRVLIVAVAVSFVLQLRFIFLSDIGYLASSWMVDDTFYYLQPAWLFKTLGKFTFDGEHVTYGFQPLWMLVLTVLARLTDDKVMFVRLAMIGGSVFYCSTAFLIYQICRRWFDGIKPLVAPLIWLFNPDLLSIYVTGKENALYAFLLMAAIMLSYKIFQGERSKIFFPMFGAVCGLLILTRVNGVIFVAFMLLALLFFLKIHWKQRLAWIVFVMLGIAVVLLPWIIYAHREFGGVLPFSGVRKLIGAKAALVHYLHQVLALRPEWFSYFLSEDDKLLLTVADKLAAPSLSKIAFFLTFYVPAMALGFGSSHALKLLYKLNTPVIIGGTLLILAMILFVIVREYISTRRTFNKNVFVSIIMKEIPFAVLLLFAVSNALVNGLLLPSFLLWGKWYAVPETLSCVLITSLALVFLFDKSIENFVPARWKNALSTVLIFFLAANLTYTLRPRDFFPANEYQHNAWEAHYWMNKNISKEDKIGSWSAGQLGYFSETATVINLDGLANSPEFVKAISTNSIMYELGLRESNVMWDYIRANKIQYIADADFDSTLGRAAFLGVIPPENFTIVYRSQHVLDWHEPRGVRRFVILKLSYDIKQ